jgi:dihydroorotate dehydrogenase electron transfer subunit
MIIERAQIITNRKLAKDIWKMKFDTPKIAKDVKGAGQFIEILTTDHWQHPLRRPMSIASFGEGVISIIYKLLGESTLRLSKKDPVISLNYWDRWGIHSRNGIMIHTLF